MFTVSFLSVFVSFVFAVLPLPAGRYSPARFCEVFQGSGRRRTETCPHGSLPVTRTSRYYNCNRSIIALPICSQFMEYQNKRGGEIKLQNIRVSIESETCSSNTDRCPGEGGSVLSKIPISCLCDKSAPTASNRCSETSNSAVPCAHHTLFYSETVQT